MLLDIDFFKRINDEYGHEAGDLALQIFCSRIQDTIRSKDTFIRWGGEEFLLVLRQLPPDLLPKVCARLKAAVSGRPFEIKETRLKVTVSGGILMVPPYSESGFNSIDAMIDLADKALYYSKNTGRNKFTEVITGTALSAVEPEMRPVDLPFL